MATGILSSILQSYISSLQSFAMLCCTAVLHCLLITHRWVANFIAPVYNVTQNLCQPQQLFVWKHEWQTHAASGTTPLTVWNLTHQQDVSRAWPSGHCRMAASWCRGPHHDTKRCRLFSSLQQSLPISAAQPSGSPCMMGACGAYNPALVVQRHAVTEQIALERQTLPRTYLAHHELESLSVVIITV